MTSRLTRLAAGLGLGAAALVLGAAPAFAHVEAEGAPAADGATTVVFSFSHGCDGSPTTSLRIQLPAGTTAVSPEEVAGFTAEATTTELSWKGGNVPDDTEASFTATMKLTGQPGDTVYFPTIQGCVQGEKTWIDKTPDPETPNAAPRIVIPASGSSTTTTEGGDHDHDAESTTTASTAATSTTAKVSTTSTAAASTTSSAAATSTTTSNLPSTSTSSSGPGAGLIAAIIIAIVVVVGLVLWLVRRNQGQKDDASDVAS